MAYLNDAQKAREYLKQIKSNTNCTDAVLGSIVKTDQMNFYISTSVGKIELENDVYYAISLSSPIGQLLKNKLKNDRFEFNQTKYIITDII